MKAWRARPHRSAGAARRRHAVEAAAVATAVAAVAALLAGLALDMLVLHRLVAEGDGRLAARLAAVAVRPPAAGPAAAAPRAGTDGDGDFDDSPALVWLVRPDGTGTPVTAGAPALPTRRWNGGRIVALPVAGRPFHLEAAGDGRGWVVVGVSVAPIQRVRNDLVIVELSVGAVLLGVVYVGALAVGLRASAPVEEVRRRQADFTADASHELRTPLSVIRAEVGLALARPRTEDYYRETLQRVAGEGDRLRSIVDDLLWLARTDARDERPGDETVDVAAVARATVERFSAVAAERRLALDWVGEQRAWAITAPAGWIDRLVAVLVDNACRYTGSPGRIRVAATGHGHHVTLTVDDDGPGIAPEQRPLLLDRFHRATDTEGGSGLGLAIADSIVRATGGQWSIGDAPLGGARFSVTWRSTPLAGASRAALAAP